MRNKGNIRHIVRGYHAITSLSLTLKLIYQASYPLPQFCHYASTLCKKKNTQRINTSYLPHRVCQKHELNIANKR